jgi:hypothetical protein
VLVVVSAAKIGLLRSALGADADRVAFADMADVGANPARIIPAWRDFVVANDVDRRSARGIGEPIWAARTPAELVECQRHETLLNLAFAGVPAWWLLCSYDTTSLTPEVLEEAWLSHPVVSERGVATDSAPYRGLEQAAAPFAAPPAGAAHPAAGARLRPGIPGRAARAGGPARGSG